MASQRFSKRRGDCHWVGHLLSFLFGSLLTLSATLYLVKERPLSKEAFSQKRFLIDQVIRSQFYEIGVVPRDIVLERSLSKGEKGITWEVSSMKIRLSQGLPFSHLEERFRRGLGRLGDPISLHSTIGKDTLELNIKIGHRTTHQLTFLYYT